MDISGVDPYKYGKQVVKRVFKELNGYPYKNIHYDQYSPVSNDIKLRVWHLVDRDSITFSEAIAVIKQKVKSGEIAESEKLKKQLSTSACEKIDKNTTESFMRKEDLNASESAKRGLVALVKEDPKVFYTAVGKGHLAHLKRLNQSVTNDKEYAPLTSLLLRCAKAPKVASDLDMFKRFVKNSPGFRPNTNS